MAAFLGWLGCSSAKAVHYAFIDFEIGRDLARLLSAPP